MGSTNLASIPGEFSKGRSAGPECAGIAISLQPPALLKSTVFSFGAGSHAICNVAARNKTCVENGTARQQGHRRASSIGGDARRRPPYRGGGDRGQSETCLGPPHIHRPHIARRRTMKGSARWPCGEGNPPGRLSRADGARLELDGSPAGDANLRRAPHDGRVRSGRRLRRGR
jgi:hypothetical protein